jgi:multiple sugar transport system permease protein
LSSLLEPYLYLGPGLLLILLVTLVPLLIGISYSFQHIVVYDATNTGFVGLENYRLILSDALFWNALWNTLRWTFASLFFQVSLGLGLALLLRSPFPGRGLYQALVFLPWAVPAFLSGLTWKWLYDPKMGPLSPLLLQLGVIHEPLNILGDPATALWGVVVANVWFGVPFFAITLLAALQAIPLEQYEAASLDGAGAWGQFVHVTLPWIRSTLLVTVLLRTIWISNFTDLVWVMTGGGPANSSQILTSYIFSTTFQKLDFGYASALSTVLLLLLLGYALLMGRARQRVA